jgi:hypothetical protein
MKHIPKLILLAILSTSVFAGGSLSLPEMFTLKPKPFGLSWDENGNLSCNNYNGTEFEDITEISMFKTLQPNNLGSFKVELTARDSKG